MAQDKRLLIKVYEDPRTGFGSIAQTLQAARNRVREEELKGEDGLPLRITREDVKEYRRSGSPSEGQFRSAEPMHQLQVDLADMTSFASLMFILAFLQMGGLPSNFFSNLILYKPEAYLYWLHCAQNPGVLEAC